MPAFAMLNDEALVRQLAPDTFAPEPNADPMQAPLLSAAELDAPTHSDTDVSLFAPPEMPAAERPPVESPSLEPDDAFGDFEDDPLDMTQVDEAETNKTLESFVPGPWDE